MGAVPRHSRPQAAGGDPPIRDTRAVTFAGEPLASTVLRGEPAPGTTLSGPALCALAQATVLVPPGWGASVDAHGSLLLEAREGA